jgi:hypothetical protein
MGRGGRGDHRDSRAGFLTLVPGGTTTSFTSTLNWWAAGLILSDGCVAPLNAAARTLTALCRSGSTHLIRDVTGY